MLVSSLLSKIKTTAATPDNQSGYDNSEILLLADDELNGFCIPMLLSARQDYLVYSETHTLTAAYIEIPYRAVANGIRDIYMLEGSEEVSIPWLSLDDVADHYRLGDSSSLYGYYFEGDLIKFLPGTTFIGKSIVIKYHMGASALSSLSGGKISSINRTTGVIVLDSAPTGLSTSEPVDLISGKTGALLAIDLTMSALTLNQATLTVTDIPTRLAVGDYLFLKEKTPVLPVPREMVNLLSLRTAASLLESLGDFEALARVEQRVEKAAKNIKALLEPRSRGSVRKLKGSGLLVSSGSRRGSRY